MPFPKMLALTALVALAAMAVGSSATAQDGRLLVELNKFEENEGGGCRAFFLFRNQTGMTLDGFEISLAVLDRGGTIDRLLTIDAAPLPVARTTLKLFEIPETACTDISEMLLYDVPSCRPQNADAIDCFEIMDLASRAQAKLVK
jgi:hypothetical protein